MKNLISQIKNFFYWGWTLRNDYNWDSQYLIKLIHIKLNRMKNEMLEKPNYYEWTTKKGDRGRKALIICEELSKRLTEENSYYMDKHYEKYPILLKFDKYINRTERNPKEHKEFMRAVEKDRAIHKLQKEMFFKQLEKWYDYWWT
jgi:hypothetical protein